MSIENKIWEEVDRLDEITIEPTHKSVYDEMDKFNNRLRNEFVEWGEILQSIEGFKRDMHVGSGVPVTVTGLARQYTMPEAYLVRNRQPAIVRPEDTSGYTEGALPGIELQYLCPALETAVDGSSAVKIMAAREVGGRDSKSTTELYGIDPSQALVEFTSIISPERAYKWLEYYSPELIDCIVRADIDGYDRPAAAIMRLQSITSDMFTETGNLQTARLATDAVLGLVFPPDQVMPCEIRFRGPALSSSSSDGSSGQWIKNMYGQTLMVSFEGLTCLSWRQIEPEASCDHTLLAIKARHARDTNSSNDRRLILPLGGIENIVSFRTKMLNRDQH